LGLKVFDIRISLISLVLEIHPILQQKSLQQNCLEDDSKSRGKPLESMNNKKETPNQKLIIFLMNGLIRLKVI